jgi:SAM-dependent methyltransferase
VVAPFRWPLRFGLQWKRQHAMVDWYDDDEFWEGTRAVVFNEARITQAPEEVSQIVALVGNLPEQAAVLDLGCGIGRHTLGFAAKGFRTTGVDRTSAYLDRARAEASQRALTVEWVEADMRQFCRPDAFDLAVNLLTSFGYFADPAEDRRVIDNLYASLKPGGHLVMDLMGKEVLARIFQQRDWHEEPDGTTVLEERTITDDWGRIDVRWITLHGTERHEYRYGLRLYAASELNGLLSAAGFGPVKTCGSFAGTPYDHEAERLIVVARKPGTV